MNKERYLLVVSGPAGSGKDTVVRQIMANHNDVELAASLTTRTPREGEVDGVDYHFTSKEKFEDNISKGELLEYTNYVGNYYGTLKSEVDKRLDDEKTCVLVITVDGAENIKKIYPECTTVFIMPPSMEELERRLRGRGTETEDKLKKRLEKAKLELEEAKNYDFVVTNDEVPLCAEEIMVILSERQSD